MNKVSSLLRVYQHLMIVMLLVLVAFLLYVQLRPHPAALRVDRPGLVANHDLDALGTPRPRTIVVGGHDEFASPPVWTPWTENGSVDILSWRPGLLTVMLGQTSLYDPARNYSRAGVFLDANVDVASYPVLVVRNAGLHGAASWDAQVLQYRDGTASNARDTSNGGSVPRPGNPEQLAAVLIGETGPEYEPGVAFVDLSPMVTPGRSWCHVRILLNVNGPRQGGYTDFAWVRFIRKQDVLALRDNPNTRDMRFAYAQ